MIKNTRQEIAEMQSLMERMDKHMTLNEAMNSKKLMVESVTCKWRDVVGPEEFYDLLSTVPNGRRVTFGYVTGLDEKRLIYLKAKNLTRKQIE